MQELQIEGFGLVYVRRNKRAKKYIMRVVDGKIIVTRPWSSSLRQVKKFVQDNEGWLEKQNLKLPKILPGSIILGGRYFKVAYSDRKTIRLKVEDDSVVGQMPLGLEIESDNAQAELRRKLKKQQTILAKNELLPMLDEIASEYGDVFNGSKVANLKTRWGSCNSRKEITLNSSLINLPERLIRHVIMHELCHLEHMNHSADFWEKLKLRDSSCNENKKLLKKFDASSVTM